METLFDIGAKIKRLRIQNNFTQKELGEKINVTDKAISKWECNKGYPDITTLPLLAECLHVDVSYFFTDSTKLKEGKINNTPNHAKPLHLSAKNKNVYLLTEIILSIIFLLIILYYNDKRIFGAYSFGIIGKEYSFNFIPFNNLKITVSLLATFVLAKIALCTVLGFLSRSILYINARKKFSQYIFASFTTIVIFELLKAFTSTELVVIDINNLLLYLIGFTIGYFAFYVSKFCISHLLYSSKLNSFFN